MLNVDGMPQKGPTLALIVFSVMPGIPQITRPGQILVLNSEMSRRQTVIATKADRRAPPSGGHSRPTAPPGSDLRTSPWRATGATIRRHYRFDDGAADSVRGVAYIRAAHLHSAGNVRSIRQTCSRTSAPATVMCSLPSVDAVRATI
ncbi:hypothetical protein ACFYNO_23145 [Kitasatospora sp. NPDC006697]|uniref:hypothetical protein n=1 Tax=Kitasatospora sp. NPDC006697 TaxID=3364020 RepID=UPI003675BE01